LAGFCVLYEEQLYYLLLTLNITVDLLKMFSCYVLCTPGSLRGWFVVACCVIRIGVIHEMAALNVRYESQEQAHIITSYEFAGFAWLEH
jgi:hypothetical protein